jgi:hippurate hydrolase
VVTVTQIHGGDAWNVIPEQVVLRGTARSFRPEVQDSVEPAIRRIAGGIAAAHGAAVALRYERRYPPTVNSAAEAEQAARVAADVAGEAGVDRAPIPLMGAEDFAFMLQKKPGAYVWLGNGDGAGGCMLHNPLYDFNDAILPIGASYWVRLAETALAK